MENIIVAFVAICAIFGFGFWMGYRLGYQRGLATWRRSYSFMTPKDVAEHKSIIGRMDMGH